MTGYRVTMWRDRHGCLWERTSGGAWSADGAADVYDTVQALRAAEGPLQAVDVDNVEALLGELDAVRHDRDRFYTMIQRVVGDVVTGDGLTSADEPKPQPPPDTSWLQTPEVREGDKRREGR